MGHGAANIIIDNFKKVHRESDIVSNLVQLSMDGRKLGISCCFGKLL